MVGTGAYASVPEACAAIIGTDKTCAPQAEAVPVYESYYQLYRKIYPALKDQYTELAAL
jgi:xylulokinase